MPIGGRDFGRSLIRHPKFHRHVRRLEAGAKYCLAGLNKWKTMVRRIKQPPQSSDSRRAWRWSLTSSSSRRPPIISGMKETRSLLAQGMNFEQIAKARGCTIGTVLATVTKLMATGEIEFNVSWVGAEKYAAIEQKSRELGTEWLKPIRDALGDQFTYDDIRLVLADLRHMKPSAANVAPAEAAQGTQV